ncbi:MAG: trigger factor [Deferribacteres bacterium]|nr:trigger factor [Deferribacteres bacterium]
MLQKVEELSPTRKKLTISIPKDVIQAETDSAYNELRTTARIPGFRPGKVPRAILVKKFGKNVDARIIEKIVPEYYVKAVREANLEPVSYPDMNDKVELKPGQPLSFSVTIEVRPEIKEINYEGIMLKEKTFTVEDEEVENALKRLQESKALYSVSDEELKDGDMAIVDSEAFIDGEPNEELSYREFPFVVGSEAMPAEFSEALMGKKKGETVTVTINFEDNHPNRTVAGKEVQFKVSITETKKKNIPPLDDELAAEAGCKNMEELRNRIRENIANRKKGQIELDYKREILDELIKRHDIDVPGSMVYSEIASLVERAKEEAMKKGEAVKPDEELQKEYALKAKENVKGVIIIEAIAKKENIQIDDEDVSKAIEEIAARNNLKPEEVRKLYAVREGSLEAMKSRLLADKVLDFVLDKATIQSES